MNEAVITYKTIDRIISATVPRSHGVTPDIITFTMVPQQKKWKRTGDITITYGRHKIKLPDCLTDETHYTFDERGELWNLKVWDYRWRWRYGTDLTGRYNIRLPDGPVDRLDPLTEKTLRELMELCLKKIKCPRGYKIVGKVPEIYPEVNWNYANPSRELQNLCDRVGFRIVAQFDGQVLIVPLGKDEGGNKTAKLPYTLPIKDEQSSYDPPEAPEKLVFVCGSDRYQYTLPLEAVGDDIDGLVKPINELSYMPPVEKWETGDHIYFNHIPLVRKIEQWYNLPNPRELAKASVYRKYRIRVLRDQGTPFADFVRKGFSKVSKQIYIPGCPVKVTDVRQILPLGSELLEPVKTEEGWFKTTPVIIWGQYGRGSVNNFELDANTSPDEIPKMILQARNPKTGVLSADLQSTVVQPEDYQIDFENGIVTFNGPVNGRMLRFEKTGTTIKWKPARLWMRGTCQVKEWGTWVPIRTEIEQDPPRNLDKVKDGRLYVEDREIFLRTVPVYNDDKITLDKVTDNRYIIEREAKARLSNEFAKMQELRPASITYAGIYPIKLNGGIQQITYTIAESGALTQASLHNEHFIHTMSYEGKRFLEKTADERTDARKKAFLDLIREKDMPFSRLSGVTKGGR